MRVLPGNWRTILSYVLIFGLLAAVNFLPPDTSLGEVRAAGVLRACVPTAYPPLVTGDPAAPGIDIELLRAIAANMGVRLLISNNAAMGRDFNPRNWHVTRAQCDVLAGGVVASSQTRSFLETSPPYAETGWAFVSPQPIGAIAGRRAGVLVGISGLDRLALSRYLREQNVEVTIVANAAEFTRGLRDGKFDFAVTEALLADEIAAKEGWTTTWAPPALVRYPVVLGLWKGDLTLKRAIVASLEKLERNGDVAKIKARYLGGNRTASCYQIALPASDFCSPGITKFVLGDNDEWRSVRVGTNSEVMLTPYLRLTADTAFLPYVNYKGQDFHPIIQFLAEDRGAGIGAQTEVFLDYLVTPQFSIGIGGRYWSLWTTSGLECQE